MMLTSSQFLAYLKRFQIFVDSYHFSSWFIYSLMKDEIFNKPIPAVYFLISPSKSDHWTDGRQNLLQHPLPTQLGLLFLYAREHMIPNFILRVGIPPTSIFFHRALDVMHLYFYTFQLYFFLLFTHEYNIIFQVFHISKCNQSIIL